MSAPIHESLPQRRFDPDRARENQATISRIYGFADPIDLPDEHEAADDDQPSAAMIWVLFGLLAPVFMVAGWALGTLIQRMAQ